MSHWSRSMSPVALVISVLALVVATSAGTAYAAVKIGTRQLKNDAVTSPKIKDATVRSADLASGGVASVDIADGAVGLSDIASSARTSFRDVRAWARIESNVSGGGESAIDASRTRGVTGLERIGVGQYCLTLDPALGIDLAKTAVLVGVDTHASYETEPHADWNSTGCSGGRLRVDTFAGSAAANDVAFVVLVP